MYIVHEALWYFTINNVQYIKNGLSFHHFPPPASPALTKLLWDFFGWRNCVYNVRYTQVDDSLQMRYWLNECVWKLMKVCLATPQISHTLFPVPATRNAGSPRMVLGSLDTFLLTQEYVKKTVLLFLSLERWLYTISFVPFWNSCVVCSYIL